MRVGELIRPHYIITQNTQQLTIIAVGRQVECGILAEASRRVVMCTCVCRQSVWKPFFVIMTRNGPELTKPLEPSPAQSEVLKPSHVRVPPPAWLCEVG